jgi:phage FluMu protein Com
MKLKDALVCDNCKEILSSIVLKIIMEDKCPKCGCENIVTIEEYIRGQWGLPDAADN